ncbi:MAG: UDP-N-acetylmuramoyl-L-alanyl-D-glutamate--2,6-diaminopimelate ligase [Steroidobacteraceae bacterium]|nr:UDP-N-acetylmuramoyl-L-alanyl-D-glutamate--2,6-diaminopimelate ligase [Steroidobacteraceae bacterium]
MVAVARSLAELTAGLIEAPAGLAVTDVTLDSRTVSPGALFLACRGRTHHGLKFAGQALARGARAVLYEPTEASPERAPEFSSDVFFARVPELSQHVGTIADRFFGSPSQALKVAGITGTNGKTTCAYLLAQALRFCGHEAAYAGTIGYGMPGALADSSHTTPDAVNVHRQLAELRGRGAQYVCMEVSSHALDQGRVNGVRFSLAAFTNLTRDHLDYHVSMDQYGAAKALLFSSLDLKARIINADDEFGARLAERASPARLIVTTRKEHFPLAEFVRATRVQAKSSGLVIAIESSWGVSEVAVPLIGDFNVENVLTVLASLVALGIPLADATRALSRCRAPSGRMEVFGGKHDLPLAIVDYAHTPDALSKALRAARMHCRGKLHVVFGCGGDRDPGKRPLMGTIAAELADSIVITDDNPRTEDPRRIVADICAGLRGTAFGGLASSSGMRPLPAGPIVARATSVRVEHDRARAITSALNAAGPDDAVVIAGKGHEQYQIYGDERRPFSDQAVIRAHFGERA